MNKILVTDTVYPKNKGDNAILLGMLHDISNELNDAEFTILSRYPADASRHFSYKVLPSMATLLGNPPLGFVKMLIVLVMAKLPKFPSYKTVEAYRNTDIVVSCGGSFITDTYFFDLYKRLYGYFIAKQLKKPLVLYAQTIGPFRFSFYKKLVSWVLNKADIIITRDKRSYDLLNQMGVETRIYQSVDAAVNLPPSSKDMLVAESMPKDKFLVGISTREWVYPGIHYKRTQIKKYMTAIAKVADYLVEKYDAHIVFASTCFGEHGYRFDDVKMATDICSLMKNRGNVTIIKNPYPVSEIKKLFGQMDFCICTRMHALIFSTTMHVPSMAIQYEFKTREYMKMLGLEEYVVDIVDMCYEELKNSVEKAIKNMDKIEDQLKNVIPLLQKKAKKSAKLVAEVLGGTQSKLEKQER